GGDRFKVGVSTTGTAQGDFTIISAGEYVTATGTWTNYSYDLSAYAGQTVYLAIVCVSNDTFVLAIDDVNVNNAKGQAVYAQNFENLPTEKTDNRSYGRSIYTGKDVPRADLDNQPSTARGTLGGYKVYRNGSSIATISNPATLTYSDIGLSNGDYSYYVTATYTDPTEESGPSNVEEVNVSVSVVPGTPSNVVTSIDGTNLVIDWDVATNADSYDVYSSADPYGTFSFESNVGTNKYIVSYTDAKKFYYIVSKSGTKEAPATIKLKKADVK
ncbi:MAG: choice-of-anchor J domain-containing protein, partial [Candidatus Delongbacteria bacterium]